MQNKISSKLISVAALLVLTLGTIAEAQSPRLYATTRQLRTLLTRIETNTDAFRTEVERNLNNNAVNTNREERISELIESFENATDTLRVRTSANQTLTGEVDTVLRQALRINNFMNRGQFSARAQTQWATIRTDLNTLAGYYRLSWDWNQRTNPSNTGGWSDSGNTGSNSGVVPPTLYATTAQVQTLIGRIKNQTYSFRTEVNRTFTNDSRVTNREERIADLIADFERATNSLDVGVRGRQALTGEVEDVYRQALRINNFALRNQLSSRAQTQWTGIRNDLNTLASYYRLSFNWDDRTNNNTGGNNGTWSNNGNNYGQLRIEGTYRLDPSRSDNVTEVLNRTLGDSTGGNSNRGIERRLASPEVIAIDAQGNTVTLATSNAPQATFEANGVANRETNQRGRTITTTATLRNNRLEINQEGDRSNDFNVVFQATGPGQLTVTKRLYLEGRGETVTVRSVYERTSNTADWSSVNSAPGWNNNSNSGWNNGNSSTNEFYIPNGTRLTARLDTTVNTRASQVGDRISLTVISPSQYNGAVIEGRLVDAASSGRVSGRANLSFSFDTLRMNGRTYNFAGIIDSVTAANGDSVTVNNEGTVRDNNQTNKTVTRAGIGAVLGAIVGAIAGGGQGAAIGATVGAGAGAGTVLISGRDTLELGPGTTFDITASAPANTRVSRY